MAEDRGVPARELSDAELERQGVRAHATRHWVFLHGTAEQFQTHTQRMLELEQEYLRRHPHRTWQGSAGTDAQATALARDSRIRDLVHTLSAEVLSLLDESGPTQADASDGQAQDGQVRMLVKFAAAPDGSLHKLEAHQIARRVGLSAYLVAALYKNEPPLLRAEGDQRVITEAGRAWLTAHTEK